MLLIQTILGNFKLHSARTSCDWQAHGQVSMQGALIRCQHPWIMFFNCKQSSRERGGIRQDLDVNEKIIRPKGKTFKGNSCIFGVEPSAQRTQLIKSHLLKTSALNRTEILFDGY